MQDVLLQGGCIMPTISIVNESLKKEALNYLSQKKTQFNSFTREWNSFAAEVPEKIRQLIISGFSTNTSTTRNGGSYNISLGFSTNASAAKK